MGSGFLFTRFTQVSAFSNRIFGHPVPILWWKEFKIQIDEKAFDLYHGLKMRLDILEKEMAQVGARCLLPLYHLKKSRFQ